jgi:predicted dehydrogenase
MTDATKLGPARFGIVGRGWRAEFFGRLARLLPERLQVVGVVTRSPQAAHAVEETWGVDTYPTTDALLAVEPEFVVVAVPWATNPGIVEAIAGAGVPVLCETPPAPDLDGLRLPRTPRRSPGQGGLD